MLHCFWVFTLLVTCSSSSSSEVVVNISFFIGDGDYDLEAITKIRFAGDLNSSWLILLRRRIIGVWNHARALIKWLHLFPLNQLPPSMVPMLSSPPLCLRPPRVSVQLPIHRCVGVYSAAWSFLSSWTAGTTRSSRRLTDLVFLVHPSPCFINSFLKWQIGNFLSGLRRFWSGMVLFPLWPLNYWYLFINMLKIRQ